MRRLQIMTAALALAALAAAASAQDRSAAPASPVPGAPRGDPQNWLTPDDYPAEARAVGARGSVSVELGIDMTGHVDACRVIASSGNVSIDRTTCWLVQRRGRFTVQKDAAGNPEHYTWTIRDIAWPRPAR